MRINLDCPYSEKEEAKKLGARWDPEKKTWYVIDPEDLKPFSRWIKALGGAQKDMKPREKIDAVKKTGPSQYVPLCNCAVLPWEDCEHSEKLIQQAMSEMYGMDELPF